jgi:tripartite-type tricarboxylate transporter receptor subunit TctC
MVSADCPAILCQWRPVRDEDRETKNVTGGHMKPSRRDILRIAAASIAMPAIVRSAFADGYPDRIVRLIVPTAPGGVADTTARILSDRLSTLWKRQVIVENKPGAGNNIASEFVAKSPPDGYNILIGGPAMAANRHIYASLNYDSVKDFAPVSLLGGFANIFVVPQSSSVTTMEEFVAFAKKSTGGLNYGTPGVGTTQHLTGELLSSVLNLNLVHVAYRGSAQALQDLLGGRLDFQVAAISTAMPFVKGGQLRALSVSSRTRYPDLPDLPTVAETVSPGFDVTSWYGFFVPAATPKDVVEKISKDTAAVMSDVELSNKLRQAAGMIVSGSDPETLRKLLASEIDLWGPVIAKAGLKQN